MCEALSLEGRDQPEMGILSWTVSAWRMRWRESATTCGHQKMSRVSQEHVTDVILHLQSKATLVKHVVLIKYLHSIHLLFL